MLLSGDFPTTEFEKELETWSYCNLIDRIIVWDRWIESGLDKKDHIREGKRMAIKVLLFRIHSLEERVRILENG
jgi:hypothetical protein